MSFTPIAEVGAKHQGVGGWLLLFCLILTIIFPLSTLYVLASEHSIMTSHAHPGVETLVMIETVLGVGLIALSVYAGMSLWTVSPRAIKAAKRFFGALIGYSLLMVILPMLVGLPAHVAAAISAATVFDLFRRLIFVAIWNSYLNRSARVRATYGTSGLGIEESSKATGLS